MLWCCWLGSRKGIWPVKKCGGVMAWLCLERDVDLHMAQLISLPFIVSCFSKIQIGITFLVPAHLVSPGQRAVKQVLLPAYLTFRILTKQSPCYTSQFPTPKISTDRPELVSGTRCKWDLRNTHSLALAELTLIGFHMLVNADAKVKFSTFALCSVATVV